MAYRLGRRCESTANPTERRVFYDQQLSRAEKDHQRAILALARVRKLLRPTVAQVNIATAGGQQVNTVSGHSGRDRQSLGQSGGGPRR
jgi:hypothetical protein